MVMERSQRELRNKSAHYLDDESKRPNVAKFERRRLWSGEEMEFPRNTSASFVPVAYNFDKLINR